MGGHEMAPHTPQSLGSAPAKPGRSSAAWRSEASRGNGAPRPPGARRRRGGTALLGRLALGGVAGDGAPRPPGARKRRGGAGGVLQRLALGSTAAGVWLFERCRRRTPRALGRPVLTPPPCP